MQAQSGERHNGVLREDDHGSPLLVEQQGSPSPPPQKQPSRPQRQRQARKGGTGDSDQSSPPSQRSSRIAGINRQSEVPPPREAPSKRPRDRRQTTGMINSGPTTQRARGTTVAARPPAKAQAKGGPGPPRKVDAPSAGAGVTKRKGLGRPARSQYGKERQL